MALDVYAAAGVTGLQAGNLSACNSALDSASVIAHSANNTAKVQAVVDAYNTILGSTTGTNAIHTSPTLEQYAAIGVTGLHNPQALQLLDSVLFDKTRAEVDTVAEIQSLVRSAKHVVLSAGGKDARATALTVQDLGNLGITGVNADNLAMVQTAVHAVSNDEAINSKAELQDLVNATLGTSAASALAVISTSALLNSANDIVLNPGVYATAGVTGVDSHNVASINSALNSDAVGMHLATAHDVQPIVNAYNAILNSAGDGATTVALTADQYTAIGVVGVSGADTLGSALHLLNNVVDISTVAKVDTVAEVQAMAIAASHVIAAAGGTAAEVAALSTRDLASLGITGVDSSNIAAVRIAIHAAAADTAVDTRLELQDLVNALHSVAASPSPVPVVHTPDLLLQANHPVILA